jgi:hypothetical protein
LQTDAGIPDAYTKYWVGHGAKTITEVYTKLKENVSKRRDLCEQAGIGFALPGKIEVVKSKKGKVKVA